eukprot:6370956-Lingulodinium_polyedra.AAC.1
MSQTSTAGEWPTFTGAASSARPAPGPATEAPVALIGALVRGPDRPVRSVAGVYPSVPLKFARGRSP